MSPQISEDSHEHSRVLGDGSVPFTGVSNGRPPDHGEGGAFGSTSSTALMDGVAGMLCDERTATEKGSNRHVKSSFRDMLTGRRSEGSTAHSILELDVEMNEDDVQISSSDGSPEINFSARLHGLVDEKSSKSSNSCGDDTASRNGQDKAGSTEKFGPWMLSTNRKSRRALRGKTIADCEMISSKQVVVGVGKFDVLASLESKSEGGEDMVAPPAPGVTVPKSASSHLVANEGSGSTRRVSSVSKNECVGVGEVVSSEKIVPVRVSLNPKAHMVVHVVEPGKELPSLSGSGRQTSSGVSLPNLRNNMPLTSGKGGESKSDPVRKKTSGRSTSKVQLGEWIENLGTELSVSGGEKSVPAVVEDELQRKSIVQWRKNTIFLTGSDQ
ncbi:hypothetical protein V6N13_018246 [Hibiscus sabdariffa]